MDAQTADRKWGIGLLGGTEQYWGDGGNCFYDRGKAFYGFGCISIERYLTPHFDLSLQGSMGVIGYLDEDFWFCQDMNHYNTFNSYRIWKRQTDCNQ